MGGAGKTALVTHWLAARGGWWVRPEVRGLFAWSFYADPSEDAWAQSLLDWAAEALGVVPEGQRMSERVLTLMRRVGLVLVLDGLEVLQEGPNSAGHGRLLGGLLRDVLTGICRIPSDGFAALTSRYVFADLERFDGGPARMLDLPAMSAEDGAELLASTGPTGCPTLSGKGWSRRSTATLRRFARSRARSQSTYRSATSVRCSPAWSAAGRTDKRVRRVLSFYAEQLSDTARWSSRRRFASLSHFLRPRSVANSGGGSSPRASP